MRVNFAPRHVTVIVIVIVAAVAIFSRPSAAAELRRVDAKVAGEVIDVAVTARAMWLSHTAGGTRRLSRVDVDGAVSAGPAVPAGAVAAGVCDDDRVYFVDERGLVDGAGVVVINKPPLLSVPDRAALPFVPVCSLPQTRGLLVSDGMWLQRLGADGAVVVEGLLPITHRARAYAGQGGRSLRGDRPYAAALSLYAPRVFTMDISADGVDDLVLVHEGHASLYSNGPGLPRRVAERDLAAIVGAPAGAELRVLAADGALLVAASVGALPERSSVSVVVGTAGAPLSKLGTRIDVDGLGLLLGSIGRQPIVARIDTSLVALSGVVLTGRVPFELRRGEASMMSLPTVADIRAGRVDGAAPVVDVDLDGDGVIDVVELGEPKRARLWREQRGSWDVAASAEIFALERAVSAPSLRRIMLVGRRRGSSTAIALLSTSPSRP